MCAIVTQLNTYLLIVIGRVFYVTNKRLHRTNWVELNTEQGSLSRPVQLVNVV